MKTLEQLIDGCPPPKTLPHDLVEKYSFHAQYHGAEYVKNDAASAKRTATGLEKAATKFAQLTTKDRDALMSAASAMRTLARNLATLAIWANKFKTHCEKVRRDDLVSEVTRLATERWNNKADQDFELALVDELQTSDGITAYATWMHGTGRYQNIAPKKFNFSLYDRHAAESLKVGDLPAHLRHLVAFEGGLGFNRVGGLDRYGDFYICLPELDEYLSYRKSIAQRVAGLLGTIRQNAPQGD